MHLLGMLIFLVIQIKIKTDINFSSKNMSVKVTQKAEFGDLFNLSAIVYRYPIKVYNTCIFLYMVSEIILRQ